MQSSCAFTSELHFNLSRHELKCRYKRKHYPSIGGKRNKTGKNKCERRSSRLEWEPSDKVCQENSSLSSAVRTTVVIERDDEGASDKVSSC